MALSQTRLEFTRPSLKQLDKLLADYPTAITTAAKITAHKTNVATLITALATANPSWASDLADLQADIYTAIDADLPTFEALKAAIIAAEYTDPQGCPQCLGTGKIQSTVDKSLVGTDPGVDNAIYVTCPTCQLHTGSKETNDWVTTGPGGDGITEGAYEAVYDPSIIPDYNPI